MRANQQLSGVSHPLAPGAPISVFPRASARIAKESVAVIGLVLAGAVLAMLVTHLAPELFARSTGSPVCGVFDPWSLLSPWCSAAT